MMPNKEQCPALDEFSNYEKQFIANSPLQRSLVEKKELLNEAITYMSQLDRDSQSKPTWLIYLTSLLLFLGGGVLTTVGLSPFVSGLTIYNAFMLFVAANSTGGLALAGIVVAAGILIMLGVLAYLFWPSKPGEPLPLVNLNETQRGRGQPVPLDEAALGVAESIPRRRGNYEAGLGMAELILRRRDNEIRYPTLIRCRLESNVNYVASIRKLLISLSASMQVVLNHVNQDDKESLEPSHQPLFVSGRPASDRFGEINRLAETVVKPPQNSLRPRISLTA